MSSGQLGTGSTDTVAHTKPARISGDLTFTTLVAGLTHTCGLTRDGAVFCWGANDSAQLGDGTTKNSPTPVRVATDVKFKTIGPGGTHTCAVSVDGVGYCWGGNWHGQLGVGDRDGDPAAPLRVECPHRFGRTSDSARSSQAASVRAESRWTAKRTAGDLRRRAGLEPVLPTRPTSSADKTVPTAVAGDVVFATRHASRMAYVRPIVDERRVLLGGGHTVFCRHWPNRFAGS